MRPIVHPNRSRPAVGSVDRIGDDLPGVRIVNLADTHVSRLAAHRISDRMRNTLALMGRQHSLIPTFSLESRRIVDGKAAVIADLHALAMIHVFMREVAPLARQIDLRKT